MKKLILIWVALLVSTFQSHAGIDDGLLLHWSFDDCSITDLTGSGYDGVISGGVTCIEGVENLAMKFTAESGAYATLAKTLDTNQGKAFSFWLNSIGFHSRDDFNTIIAKRQWGGDLNFIFTSAYNTTQISRICAEFFHDGSSYDGDMLCSYYPDPPDDQTVEVLINDPFEFGTWNHIVVNVLDSEIEMWINGQLVSKKDRLYATYYNSGIATRVANVFLTGSDFNYDYYLNGTLDEFRVYSRPLSHDEICVLFGGVCSNPSIKPQISIEDGYFKMDTTNGLAPPSDDCFLNSHYGRMIVDEINNYLYVCTKSGWTIN